MLAALNPPIDVGENVDALLAIADGLAGDEIGHTRVLGVYAFTTSAIASHSGPTLSVGDAGDVDAAGADDVDRVLLLEGFDLLAASGRRTRTCRAGG